MRAVPMDRPRRVLCVASALAGLAVLAPGAAYASTVVYSGTTAADQYPLVMTVSGARIVGITSMWRAVCGSGKAYDFGKNLSLAQAPIAIRNGGRFSGSVVVPEQLGGGENALVTLMFKGTLKGAKLSGTMTGAMAVGSDPSGPSDTCAVTDLKFSLLHQPGTEYGGVTSQGLPVVVELGGGGRTISHLHVGWLATCTSGYEFQFADFLSGGAVFAGRFGGTFTTNEARAGGGTMVSDYEISGKLTRTAGSGRLKLTVTPKDAAGTVEDTCATPAVTFRVRG